MGILGLDPADQPGGLARLGIGHELNLDSVLLLERRHHFAGERLIDASVKDNGDGPQADFGNRRAARQEKEEQ